MRQGARDAIRSRRSASVLAYDFTYRQEVIRIFGAGYWTGGLRLYEKANKVPWPPLNQSVRRR
jgi:hypothetical protein